MPSEKVLDNLVINRVPTQEIYNKLKSEGRLNPDELYMVEDVGESLEDHNTSSTAHADIRNSINTISTNLSSHNHDDRYYTESEVNSLLAGKANSSHAHDDRYYTESEVNSLLSGKANSSHTHDYAASAHSHGAASIGAGTLPADVKATMDNSYTDHRLRNIMAAPNDLGAGVAMTNGLIYLYFE